MLVTLPKGDVQQTVDAAEIDKGAVVGQVLDDAVDLHALLEVLQQGITLGAVLLLDHRSAGDHHVVAALIELDHLELQLLALEVAGVAHRTHVDQRPRQEGAHAAELHGEAALDLAVDDTADRLTRLEGLVQHGPDRLALRFLTRQAGGPGAILDGVEGNLDLIADGDLQSALGIVELVLGDDSLGLQAGIDDHRVGGNSDHGPGDDGTRLELGDKGALFKEFGKAFGHEVSVFPTHRVSLRLAAQGVEVDDRPGPMPRPTRTRTDRGRARQPSTHRRAVLPCRLRARPRGEAENAKGRRRESPAKISAPFLWGQSTSLRPSPREDPTYGREHAIEHLGDRERGGVDHQSPPGCDERRHRPPAIACVTRLDLGNEGGETNIHSFVFQLFISTRSALLRARGQEYLHRRVGEHHAPHVAAIGHQARWAGRCTLPVEQNLAHRRVGRDARGRAAGRLGADQRRDVCAVEQHPCVAELQPKPRSQAGERLGRIQIDPPALRGEPERSVEGTAVQAVPSQSLRQQLRDRPRAGARGAVDGNDRYRRHPTSSRIASPVLAASGAKPGKDVRTLAQSPMAIGPAARKAAIANAMAMRWSP